MQKNVLSIKLNGKIYTTIPKGRAVRRAMEFATNMQDKQNNFDVSDLDNMVNYVVELFDNKFTIDDVYDGIDADKLMSTILDCITSVVNMFANAGKSDPNVQTGK